MVGALNTGFGLTAIFIGKYLGLGDYSANFVGYALGLVLSFQLNSRWSFRNFEQRGHAALRFLAVFAIAWMANLLALTIMLHGLTMNAWIAQALSVIVYTVTFYIGARRFVFSQPTRTLPSKVNS